MYNNLKRKVHFTAMKKILLFTRFIFNLLKVAKNPEKTEGILKVSDILWKLGLLDSVVLLLKQDPHAERCIRERRLLSSYEINKLAKLPVGSLAETYARHMISNNLKPDFYKKMQIGDDVTYFMMRMRETHDLWHVITGFGTDVPSELGLQAFMIAQLQTPLSSILIASRTFFSTFKNPNEISQIYNQLAKGWTMGREAHKIFALDWEENWETPLSEIRAKFNVSVPADLRS